MQHIILSCRYSCLHVGMTLIQNGSYFWLKMHYHMYLSFLIARQLIIPAFVGALALPRSNVPKSLVSKFQLGIITNF